MATKVEEAIKEINDLLVVFIPQHEGLRDYALLNLSPPTHQEVRQSIIMYDRRKAKLEAAKAALVDLMADGHPDLPVREIDPQALRDLQNNAATIQAALARFASNTADDMRLAGGDVEPKP